MKFGTDMSNLKKEMRLIETWDVLKSFQGCKYGMFEIGLIETWDVLKCSNDNTVGFQNVINRNMGCIEI